MLGDRQITANFVKYRLIISLIQVSVKRKESYLYDTRTCSENMNNVQLYLIVCVEVTYLKYVCFAKV